MTDSETAIPEPAIALEDDKPVDVKVFEGATLQIAQHDDGPPSNSTDQAVNKPNSAAVDVPASMTSELSRNRPGSIIGRMSVKSTSSRTSMKPGTTKSDIASRSYYCYKESQFEKAVSQCKSILKPHLDGELRSSWLLTEIDHWDLEREKIVLLTEYSLFIVKYNFITEKLQDYRRIMLHIFLSLHIGDFKYPDASLMPDRAHGGVKICWGKREGLTFGQKWNPWSSDIPWCVLCHHPLIYNPKENETATYNADEFFESLVTSVSKVYTEKRPGENLEVVEGPIVIESYASPVSMVFNQSSIGYCLDRNGVSF